MRLKPGDLICYNAAGMKYKTLGLVIETNDMSKLNGRDEVLIMWAVVGEYMPRKCIKPGFAGGLAEWHSKIISGDLAWHELGRWFEVVK